jgi:hypothetical protein
MNFPNSQEIAARLHHTQTLLDLPATNQATLLQTFERRKILEAGEVLSQLREPGYHLIICKLQPKPKHPMRIITFLSHDNQQAQRWETGKENPVIIDLEQSHSKFSLFGEGKFLEYIVSIKGTQQTVHQINDAFIRGKMCDDIRHVLDALKPVLPVFDPFDL